MTVKESWYASHVAFSVRTNRSVAGPCQLRLPKSVKWRGSLGVQAATSGRAPSQAAMLVVPAFGAPITNT